MQHTPGFQKIVNEIKKDIKEVDVHLVQQKINNREKFCLIDVREESEWQQGRLPQAQHISKGVIERDIEHNIPEKHTQIILYCGGGYRSALAAYNLQKMGYTNVSSMDGGFRGWLSAGYQYFS